MKKTKINYLKFLLAGLTLALSVGSCQLDYENTAAINPDNVWKDPVMIKAYVSDIHGGMMPGWPISGNSSDEASNGQGQMGNYLRGIIDVNSTAAGTFNYSNIDKINYFLSQITTVPESVMTQSDKDKLVGQMLFWRAWDYFGKVTQVGGVPLITKVQNIEDKASLFVPRNKTSECMAQIIADLDEAIAKLPSTWSGADYGRIDKCAAAAMKGKVLMWWASPLFNPTNDQTRWANAYTATKTAVDICVAAGKGLRPKFADIWNVERNQEVIMVNQFYNSDHTFNNNSVRPGCISKDAADNNMPYLPLITAFSKKDGTPLVFDPAQAGNDTYNQQFLTDMYTNLDDRFYATVFAPGTVYPGIESTAGLLKGGQRLWTSWEDNGPNYTVSMINKQFSGTAGNTSPIGFYAKKGIDPNVDRNTYNLAGMDWVEIRFAEVLMNYGECANETGKTAEAITVLKQIRARAGVTGVNNGITATTQAEVRANYITERFAEFALENKRFGDLRRWKRFDILNARGARQGIKIVIKDNSLLTGFDWTQDMATATTRAKFKAVYIPSIDLDANTYKFNLDLNHWFYPINKTDIDRNSKIEQNNEWGGTFDPLK
ncbi:RagB/SusD family nutrient uptake outer membrane protein [Flavobacterium gilvum]|uniref:Carbohydrate-binding protein SusD n=1 Tax=Flavobacterium gilvum TaxID=1492737 RepID=A0AAC9N6L4_9FLAO|nr:RagB/SusD family nutrient uptake outer membrane protein [Flavobacterium gilvum]AOW11411.1 hypothetical protein EM308_14200 [Flavobacterium gilvum]KFC59575.1 susD family protein [Flavobacterium gilvum]